MARLIDLLSVYAVALQAIEAAGGIREAHGIARRALAGREAPVSRGWVPVDPAKPTFPWASKEPLERGPRISAEERKSL